VRSIAEGAERQAPRSPVLLAAELRAAAALTAAAAVAAAAAAVAAVLSSL
jgi:hypothetical protein